MNPDIPMLDSTSCPLNGVCMIEAAAGTGKTYNIQNLVLRLILEQDIPISGILVVTFTEAATAELRTRIRDMLRNALNYAAGSAIPEKERPRIKAIMEHAAQNTPGETLVRRLRNAFIDFDSSTISTIHGFCQRMLTENAFESGVLFNTVIQKDQDEIILDLRPTAENCAQRCRITPASRPIFISGPYARCSRVPICGSEPVRENLMTHAPSWSGFPDCLTKPPHCLSRGSSPDSGIS